MKPEIILYSNIVEANGKTIRENNLELKHNIPIGTLVEVELDEWYGDGAYLKGTARLFVICHGRDCDGEPLYWLAKQNATVERFAREIGCNESVARLILGVKGGFPEESLKVI